MTRAGRSPRAKPRACSCRQSGSAARRRWRAGVPGAIEAGGAATSGLEPDPRPGQLGEGVPLSLAHRFGAAHLPRSDVLNGDVDLLVDLRVNVNRPVFHVPPRAELYRIEKQLDDVVAV